MAKYNTEKNKHILIPIELKEELDSLIESLTRKELEQGNKRPRVSYADAIKSLMK